MAAKQMAADAKGTRPTQACRGYGALLAGMIDQQQCKQQQRILLRCYRGYYGSWSRPRDGGAGRSRGGGWRGNYDSRRLLPIRRWASRISSREKSALLFFVSTIAQ